MADPASREDAGTPATANAGRPEREARAAGIARAWLLGWAAVVHEARGRLTDLDAAIGDGDHGINLDRGLTAVAAELSRGHNDNTDERAAALDRPADAAAILGAAGRRIMGTVGGASGALYGRAFVRAGAAVELDGDPDRLPEAALAAAIQSISDLGHAVPGDKTMLDALVPALEALHAGLPGEPIAARVRRAADAAQEGALATVPLLARKGRASYLGERSIGHLDPGAVSSAMLIRCLAEAVERT